MRSHKFTHAAQRSGTHRRPVRRGIVPALALIALLAGCGRFGAAPTPTPEPVTLRYIALNPDGAEQVLLDAYEAAYPHVTVAVSPYQLLPADYVTETDAPELLYITPGWFLDSAAATGQLTDLTDLWEQTGLAERYPAGLQALSAQDGRQVFLPLGYRWIGLYYNRGLFEELGIAPPATWDDLMLAADVLLDAGIRPFALAGEDLWLTSLWFDYLVMRLHGPDVLAALQRGEIPYTDARVEDALTTWRWMFENGYFDPIAYRTDTLTALMSVIHRAEADFVSQKAGMLLAGPDFLTELPEPLRADLAFVPFPVIDPNVPTGEVAIASGYVAPATATHSDEALRFLEYAATDAGAEALAAIALEQDLVPATGIDGLENIPDRLLDGARLVSQADVVRPPFIFGLTFDEQAAFGRVVDTLLREVNADGTFNVEAATTALDAALR